MIPIKNLEDGLSQLSKLASDQTLIIDLDHTLHLSSSTEQFIDMARPASLAATGLAALGALKPWRFSADSAASRDHLRVLFVVIFFPWTILRWRRRAVRVNEWNTALVDIAVNHKGPVVVASNGFRVAVVPRVRQVLPDAQVIARRVFGRSPQSADKCRRVVAALGSEVVADSAVVTDSNDDSELLQACSSPFLLQWPGAFWNRALADAYIPLQYSAAKHTKRSVLWAVFLDDLPIAVLVTAIGSHSPARSAVATLSLLVATRCIYDSGYNENDHHYNLTEAEPTLRPNAVDYKNSVPLVPVMFWVAGLITAAVIIASPDDLVAPFDGTASRRLSAISAGFAVAIFLRIAFFVFNRLAPLSRRWVHPFLQVCRYGIFAAVLSVSPVGVLALAAQMLHRTVPYWIYRSPRSPDRYPTGRWSLLRLIAFMMLAILSIPFFTTEPLMLIAVLVWFAIRARRDIRIRSAS